MYHLAKAYNIPPNSTIWNDATLSQLDTKIRQQMLSQVFAILTARDNYEVVCSKFIVMQNQFKEDDDNPTTTNS